MVIGKRVTFTGKIARRVSVSSGTASKDRAQNNCVAFSISLVLCFLSEREEKKTPFGRFAGQTCYKRSERVRTNFENEREMKNEK